MSNNQCNEHVLWSSVVFAAFLAIALLVAFIWGSMALGKIYGVWAAGKDGQAELQQADWNRQIKVREAAATEQSATLLAQAEVERAKGVAQANKIIGDSLKDNQDYLRYLWIQNLQNDKNQVIYVPTEGQLPILEAGRLNEMQNR